MPSERRPEQPETFDPLLDAVNRRLLSELQADARLRTAELARRVGLSPPAVADRVRRLEEAGVITGYHAQVDPRALGFPIAAIVRVQPNPQQLPRIRALAADLPEVVECHRITGEDCFVVTLRLRSLDDLESVLDRFGLHGRTTTSIVHSTPVPPRPVPVSPP